MDSGESAAEACIREVMEETGLKVRVTKLVGIYTSPDLIIEYDDGNRWQPVAITFEVEVVGGRLRLSDETTDYGFFRVDSLDDVDLMEHHLERVQDAVKNSSNAIMK